VLSKFIGNNAGFLIMIRSMTAFARRDLRNEWGELTWEIRSLNHRYLEVNTRMPEELRSLEGAVRERVGKVLGRGKVDCNLRFQRAAADAAAIRMNSGYAQRVIELYNEANALLEEPSILRPMDLLRWPGVVEEIEADLESVGGAALTLLDEALKELVVTREREGGQLKTIVEQRCNGIAEIVGQVRAHLPAIKLQLRERLQGRLADLNVESDSGRLEQEMVIQLQKMDVDEELDRLDTHIQEISKVLTRTEPVGRRLDFLMQELNREANTLGSKSIALETGNASVDLKVLIEQMREQIQNIE
jgi:uncharacterized protein (TIGR00255 family)